jgi:hypothetical protein
LPYAGVVWNAEVSADGKKIAWLTEEPNEHNHFGGRYDLWVSDLAGIVITEIGSVEGSSESSSSSATGIRYYWPQDIKWNPDGARISFHYRDALWTVPVSWD